MKTNKSIRCISCRFAKVDEYVSESRWKAYECSNPESKYHKALLNVSADGDKHTRISWSGVPVVKEGEWECPETKETLPLSRLSGTDRG